MSITILLISLVLLGLGYIFYARHIAGKLSIDPNAKTPAHTMHDGVDYCPAKLPILFGHHFASVAGAAPIVGPIVALSFGWLPVIIWIVIGSIFLGAVHDFSALIASVRHHGRSIGEVIGVNLGGLGRRLFLIFLWGTLVLLIAVFIVVTVKTFDSVPSAGTSSVLFILLAVIFGITIHRWSAPVWLATIIGLLFLSFCMIVGWYYPADLSTNVWSYILIGYIFIASVTPVWILLQPRDYLNSFLLYAILLSSIVGIFVANSPVNMPFFTHWTDPTLGTLFPILFVTVACGAISGFHSVVASGTTAKQLNTEADAKKIGYGAMIVEAVLAILAVLMASMLFQSDYITLLKEAGPVTIFARGAGKVISSLGFPENRATTFAAVAVSAFVLTSLDTATRLARFAFQEFFAPKGDEKPSILHRNRFIATAVTVIAAAALALSGKWPAIWPIFGSANQLLAALTLLAVTVWLMRGGIKSRFTFIPMIIMFIITISALAVLISRDFAKGNWGLFVIGILLLGVSAVLVVEAVIAIRKIKAKNNA